LKAASPIPPATASCNNSPVWTKGMQFLLS
jgi:hypothetical protein